MARKLEAYAIQFLSRDCIPGDIAETYQGQPLAGKDITFRLSLRKEGLKQNVPGPRRPPADLPDRKPVFSQPWPTNPSIGAFEFVDPYHERRWPTYLTLEGEIELHGEEQLLRDLVYDLADQMRNILWGLFNTMELLKALIDQRTASAGYRWAYITTMSDFDRNPFPNPQGKYRIAPVGVPIGPGFSHLPSFRVTDVQGLHEFATVWSQSISLPAVTDPKADSASIDKRVQEIKTHWNSFQELQDAERYSKAGDIKGTIRSAASAVDAALGFYCAEWNVKSPSKVPFNEKIDRVLAAANRPLYNKISPQDSKGLLHLYRARNSMHEGDRYFRDSDTGCKREVDHKLANTFLGTAEKFILWIDSQA